MSSSSCSVCVCVCVLCFIEYPLFAYVLRACDAGRGCSLTFVHAAACRRFSVPSADLTARRPVSQRQKWLLQRQSCTYCFEAAIFLLLLLPVITGVAATLTYTDTFLVLCASSPPPVVCLSRQCFFKGERGREVRREGLLHSNRLWQFLGWHGGADCSC